MRYKPFLQQLILLGVILFLSSLLYHFASKTGLIIRSYRGDYVVSNLVSISKHNVSKHNVSIKNVTSLSLAAGGFNSSASASVTKNDDTCADYSGIPYDKQIMNKPLPSEIVNLIKNGGAAPKHCRAKEKVAIIIPFRGRQYHLNAVLNCLHRLLHAQNQDYHIFVVNQLENTKFNRAMLFNIGVAESLKQFNSSCLIFHDTDMMPERLLNRYDCRVSPRHLSYRQDRFIVNGKPYATGEEMWKLNHNGGVMALTKEQFIKINGFSNLYFGWGREDDDFALRIQFGGYKITKESNGYYKTFQHARDKHNEHTGDKGAILLDFSKERQKCEGYNSLNIYSCYTVKEIKNNQLYTEFAVYIPDRAACPKK